MYRGKRRGPEMFEQWLPNGSHRLGCLLRMLGVAGAAPDDRADVFVVKMLWKHRSRWNDEKGKKAVDVFRSILNKFPIGAEYLRRLLQRPESGAELNNTHGMELKLK